MSKRTTSLPCCYEGVGQRACTVPTSTLTTVIRIKLSTSILLQGKGSGSRFHPTPLNGVGIPARIVKTLDAMKVNNSDLFETLLNQYEPFLNAWAEMGYEEYQGDDDE